MTRLPWRFRAALSSRSAGFVIALALASVPAHAAPILHERISDDAESDLALGAVMAGDIPAVVETPSGFIGAPDPRKPPGSNESAYQSGQFSSVPGMQQDASFMPDRDTRRPDTLPYDDPFTPSTAPFKRLVAFDAVRADFSLTVLRPDLRTLPRGTQADAADDRFFGDVVIEAQPGKPVRIPTVGPGARLLHAHVASGAKDVKFNILHDEADNWFIEVRQPTRARLVMDLAIRRATFGGEIAKANWVELPRVAPLPPNVAASARIVAEKIGIHRDMQPHEVIRKMVAYFRAFRESEEPPKPQRDVYLDLAFAQKGVCRHRAFAFLITSLGIGIPARMVLNEAHAWVEVHDGRLWRRIDLGGAGRVLANPLVSRTAYEAPSDPFGWPQGATRGEDIAGLARASPAASPTSGGRGAGRTNAATSPSATPATSSSAAVARPAGGVSDDSTEGARKTDSRPASSIELSLDSSAVRRGEAIRVRGSVSAANERCAYVTVGIVFRQATGQHEIRVGALATDAKGDFSGNVVIPPGLSVGEYDIVAATRGDLRCGASP